MKEIAVNASKKYSVFVGEGALAELGEKASGLSRGRRALLVSGSDVFPLYGKRVAGILEASGFQVCMFRYSGGEESKNIHTLSDILEYAAENELTRDDTVFALGGGVTGDLAALAAALYKRGVACVQIPTTLLAMVDSSVGGKTAVNLSRGKNLAGVFSQPSLVLCDTDCLATLPKRIYSEGWAEIIKYAFIDGGKIYTLIKNHSPIETIISACIETKSALVERDELDRGERRLLNFGHTVGHALEWLSEYKYLHGEAVAVGMAVITRGCRELSLCDSDVAEALEDLLGEYALPSRCEYSAAELLEATREDKKRAGDRISLVLPERLGVCKIIDADYQLLERIIRAGL